MSNNSESQSIDSERDAQPKLTDFIDSACPVCGRKYGENGKPCHPTDVVTIERRLAEQDWLFSKKRPPSGVKNAFPVIGNDCIRFEPLYLALGQKIRSGGAIISEYAADSPYSIQRQEWIATVYQEYLPRSDEIVPGTLAGIRASQQRLTKNDVEATPARVFAHLVFLDQYGLLPRYDQLRPGNTKSLREICAEYYGVSPDQLDSEWVIKRRVDRSKVYSTTPEFRKEWELKLVDNSIVRDQHPHSNCRPFDGTAILGDHRDHNLIARRAKTEFLRLPNVDWCLSPHIFYSRSGYRASQDTPSKLPVLGFDLAGFAYTSNGQRLRYLGIVVDWNEGLFEVYLQAIQIGKTAATGVLILPNREWIFDFLHFLKRNELTKVPHVFPDSRDQYRSIPNVQALHERVIEEIPLFDEMALLPRRKLLDEGTDTLSDLISVQTYA